MLSQRETELLNLGTLMFYPECVRPAPDDFDNDDIRAVYMAILKFDRQHPGRERLPKWDRGPEAIDLSEVAANAKISYGEFESIIDEALKLV